MKEGGGGGEGRKDNEDQAPNLKMSSLQEKLRALLYSK